MKKFMKIFRYFTLPLFISTLIFGYLCLNGKSTKKFIFASRGSILSTSPEHKDAQVLIQQYAQSPLPIMAGTPAEYVRYVDVPDQYVQNILKSGTYANGIRIYFVRESD